MSRLAVLSVLLLVLSACSSDSDSDSDPLPGDDPGGTTSGDTGADDGGIGDGGSDDGGSDDGGTDDGGTDDGGSDDGGTDDGGSDDGGSDDGGSDDDGTDDDGTDDDGTDDDGTDDGGTDDGGSDDGGSDDGIVSEDTVRLDTYVHLLRRPIDVLLLRRGTPDVVDGQEARFIENVEIPDVDDPFEGYDVTEDCPHGGTVNLSGFSASTDFGDNVRFGVCVVGTAVAHGTIFDSSGLGGRETSRDYRIVYQGVETSIGFGATGANWDYEYSCDACDGYSFDARSYFEQTAVEQLLLRGTGNYYREYNADPELFCDSPSGSAEEVSIDVDLRIVNTELETRDATAYTTTIENLRLVDVSCDGVDSVLVVSVDRFRLHADDGSGLAIEAAGTGELFNVTLTDSEGTEFTDTVTWSELSDLE